MCDRENKTNAIAIDQPVLHPTLLNTRFRKGEHLREHMTRFHEYSRYTSPYNFIFGLSVTLNKEPHAILYFTLPYTMPAKVSV